MKTQSLAKSRKTVLVLPGILLLITLISGLLLVRFLDGVGRGYLREQSEDILEAMTSGIQNELESAQYAVGAMAGSPWILPAFLDPSSEKIEEAHSVLDRYNSNLGFSVCYLLNIQGVAIASSNRSASDSFVGKNYGFRPYFQEALRGNNFLYMATGVTSRERGFYAAHPVKDSRGKVVGVAVVKKNIDAVKRVLIGYANAFFLSPEGVVFISGSREAVLKPLWPLSSEQIRRLKDSKQFSMTSFEPILSGSVQNGEKILFRGERCQVFRKPLGPRGWSLVLLASLKSVAYFILFGWIVTAFVAGIIFILIVWMILRHEGQERLRESEEKYRSLFENSRDAIMILNPPSWKFVAGNPATVAMFRTKDEDEFISLGPWDLSPERQPDGRLSSEKSKEMIETAAREGVHFFEWMHKRLGGEDFPATVLLTRMVVDKETVILATVRDITERKKTEEALKQKMAELERFNRIAVGRELKMIELKERIKALEGQKNMKD